MTASSSRAQAELLLDVLASFSGHYDAAPSTVLSFDETDLRLANRGGARISSTEIGAILEHRHEIERALGEIHPDASLTAASRAVPWPALTRLFEAFGDIRGVGLSKTTKALHKKRPALIPILDSVVQDYLTRHDSVTASGSFAGSRHGARPPVQARHGSQPRCAPPDPTRARAALYPSRRCESSTSSCGRCRPNNDRTPSRGLQPPLRSRSRHDEGVAPSATPAQRGGAELDVPPPAQLVSERDGHSGSRRAERVPERH